MAYIVDYAITENGAGGATSIICNMPPHDPNDILLAIVAVNGTTAVSMTAAAGTWAQIGTTQTANAGITSAAFWMRADVTDTETATVALTAADDYAIKIIAIKDCVTTGTPFNVQSSTNSGTATASQFNSVAVTTTVADSLIIYAHALDGSVPQVHSDPGVHHLISSDATGTSAQTSSHSSVSWYIQRAIGTTPTPSWTANAAAVRTNHTIAFTNRAGGRIPAYIDDVTSPGTVLHPGLYIGTLNNTVVTTTFTSTAAINSKTVGTSTAVLGADFGINSYSNAVGRTAAVTAATALNGYQITFTGNRNLSTGIVMGAVIAGTPKMGTFGLGSIAQGGYVVRLGSSATAWNAYQVAAKNTAVTTEGRYVFAIQPGYTASTYGVTQGTAVNTAAVSHMQFLLNCPGFATTLYLSDLTQVFTQVVAGGDANFPVDADGLAEIGKSFRIPVLQKVGASVLCFAPVQIGGGDAVNFNINAGAIQFPRRYNQDAKELAYHAADNFAGISFAAKLGDSVSLTNSVITSPTPYRFEILSTATSAASWNFSGTTIVNAAVTLKPVVTFDTITFNNCITLNTSDCAVSNSSISLISTTTPPLTVTSSTTFLSCRFNTTGISAGVAQTQTAVPSIFTDCEFTGSNTTGHAFEITTPGTYSLSGNLFTSYGSTGTTSAAVYNNSGGTVTLNIVGGGTPPTYRNGTAATTVINAAFGLTFEGLQLNSEVRVYLGTDPSTSTQVAGVENSGTTFATSHSVGGQQGYYVIHAIGFVSIFRTFTFSGSDTIIPITQQVDRTYSNPV